VSPNRVLSQKNLGGVTQLSSDVVSKATAREVAVTHRVDGMEKQRSRHVSGGVNCAYGAVSLDHLFGAQPPTWLSHSKKRGVLRKRRHDISSTMADVHATE
jgi:hypothetical protein